jgi:hypothetical protein
MAQQKFIIASIAILLTASALFYMAPETLNMMEPSLTKEEGEKF